MLLNSSTYFILIISLPYIFCLIILVTASANSSSCGQQKRHKATYVSWVRQGRPVTLFQLPNKFWITVLGLIFPLRKWPISWLECYNFKFLRLKVQPKLCFGVEVSSEPTPDQFWGWVFNLTPECSYVQGWGFMARPWSPHYIRGNNSGGGTSQTASPILGPAICPATAIQWKELKCKHLSPLSIMPQDKHKF